MFDDNDFLIMTFDDDDFLMMMTFDDDFLMMMMMMMMTFGPKRPTLSKIAPPQTPQNAWCAVLVDCLKTGQLLRMISCVCSMLSIKRNHTRT